MEYITNFLSRIHWEEIGFLIISITTIILIVKFVEYAAQHIAEAYPKKRMVVLGWIPFFSFVSYFIGITAAFYIVIHPSKEVFIGFLAWSIVALGIGMKDIASSIIAGATLIMDRPFQVGDRITFGNIHGDVLSIGIHSVKIMTLDESVVTIPNQNFISNTVSSNSAGEFGMVTTVDINLKPTADLAKAKIILKKLASDSVHVDGRQSIIILVKEKLVEKGNIIFVMQIKCILKDARAEQEFQTDLLISANKALREKKLR